MFAKDVNGMPIPHDRFFLRFRELNQLESPDPRVVAAIVNEFVTANAPKQRMRTSMLPDPVHAIDTTTSDETSMQESSPGLPEKTITASQLDDGIVIRSIQDVDEAYLASMSCIHANIHVLMYS